MSQPLLHIGYQKAASTWLQEHLFDNAEAGLATPVPQKPDVIETFVLPPPLEFDAAAARARFHPALAAARERGEVPVVSAERMVGSVDGGGYDSLEIADRLRRVFPDGRVLVIIREQRAMLLSTYKAYIKVGGACSWADWTAPPRFSEVRLPRFRFAYYEYDRLIAAYHERFGAEHVCVTPFEMLRADPGGFIRRIVGFAGGRVPNALPVERASNPGLGSFYAALRRRVNPFVTRSPVNGYSPLAWDALTGPAHRLIAGIEAVAPRSWREDVDRRWKAAVAQSVGTRYRESNARTAAIAGLDLKAYGYDL